MSAKAQLSSWPLLTGGLFELGGVVRAAAHGVVAERDGLRREGAGRLARKVSETPQRATPHSRAT